MISFAFRDDRGDIPGHILKQPLCSLSLVQQGIAVDCIKFYFCKNSHIWIYWRSRQLSKN